jgi:hypothetical protein
LLKALRQSMSPKWRGSNGGQEPPNIPCGCLIPKLLTLLGHNFDYKRRGAACPRDEFAPNYLSAYKAIFQYTLRRKNKQDSVNYTGV